MNVTISFDVLLFVAAGIAIVIAVLASMISYYKGVYKIEEKFAEKMFRAAMEENQSFLDYLDGQIKEMEKNDSVRTDNA